MASNLLILCPSDPFSSPDVDQFTALLSRADFIGAPLPADGFYKPGAEFFHFVTFLGCSPVVALGEPGPTAEICRVEIASPLANPIFLAGANVRPPRCPGCDFRSTAGRAIGEAWEADPHNQTWVCPACERQYSAPQLGWRHSAAFWRFFLRIWGIFEGEAVPSEHFMALLQAETNKAWNTVYLQQQD